MARFLITGGAGFVGMHLSHALTGAGHEVDILDNLSTGRRANLAPGVRFHESDINNTQLLRDVLQDIPSESQSGWCDAGTLEQVRRCSPS